MAIKNSPIPASHPKYPTGITGLDEITGGGLPRGRPTLVAGGAACGKRAKKRIQLDHVQIELSEIEENPRSLPTLTLDDSEREVKPSARVAQEAQERAAAGLRREDQLPLRRFIGDMSHTGKILLRLDLRENGMQPQ